MLQSPDCLQIFTLQPNIAKSLCLSRILWNVFKSFVLIREGMTERNLYKTPTLMLGKGVRSNYQTFKTSKKCIPHTGTITRHKFFFYHPKKSIKTERVINLWSAFIVLKMGQWQWEHKLVLSPETHVSETLLTHANKHRKALEWHTKRWGQRFK